MTGEKFLAIKSKKLQSTYLSEDFVPEMKIRDKNGNWRKFYYILWDYVPWFDNEVLRWVGKKIALQAKNLKSEIIMGIESSGIAIATAASIYSGLPFGFVRKSVKNYGLGNYIEGEFGSRKRVVLIDNFTATGGTFVKAAKTVINEGFKVDACISVDCFDKLPKTDGFDDLPFNTIIKSSRKIDELIKINYFPQNIAPFVKEFVNTPELFFKPSKIHDEYIKELNKQTKLRYII